MCEVHLQGWNGDVVIRSDGDFEVDEAAAVQLVYQRHVGIAQPHAARPRRLSACRQLHGRQAPELHLA